MDFKQIDIIDIHQYLPEAKKAGLVFCDNTVMFGVYDGAKLMSFCGMLFYANKVILKNAYVPAEHRSKGLYKYMMQSMMNVARDRGIKKAEGTCTKMSLPHCLKIGFRIIKEYKEYTKVIHENL